LTQGLEALGEKKFKNDFCIYRFVGVALIWYFQSVFFKNSFKKSYSNPKKIKRHVISRGRARGLETWLFTLNPGKSKKYAGKKISTLFQNLLKSISDKN
jgi:hypothetical protein